jgi:ABC-type branched-subunit amino acid transport system substrate-binding protein
MLASMRKIVCLVTTAVLSTACGSTVATQGTAASQVGGTAGSSGLGPAASGGDGLGDGLAAPFGDAGAVADAPDGVLTTEPGVGGPRDSVAGGGSVASGSGAAASGAGTAGGAAGGRGTAPGGGGVAPGVTDDTILIGITDAKSQDQVVADAGIKGASQGSNARMSSALVEHINRNGGVAGRKLKLLVYNYDSSSTPEDQAAAGCAHFTQDNRVFAVLSYGQTASDITKACLSKKNVPLLSSHGTHFDDTDLRTYPTLWPVAGFNAKRKAPAYVDGLAASGFFTPWDQNAAAPAKVGTPKVGLVYFDDAFNKRINPSLRAALSRHGMKFAREAAIRTDDTGGQADLKSAVLRFSSEGITHVLFNSEVNAGMFGLFAVNAASQAYYPRYGVASFDFPALVKANLPDHKPLNGMKGIGWLPTLDVDTPAPLTAAQKFCLKIYQDKGITPADNNQRQIMLTNCDVFFKFAKAASFAGTQLNTASFFAGVQRLGAAEPTYGYTPLDYSRHVDGVSNINYLEFHAPCDCIRYTKTGVRIP